MEYLAGEAENGSVMVNLGVLEMLTGTGVPEDAAVLQNNAAAQNLAGTAAENTAEAAVQAGNANMTESVVNMLSSGQGGMEAVYAAGGTAIAEAVNEAEILNMQQTTSVENIIAELGTDAEGSGANWMNGFGSDEDGTSFNTTTEFSMQSNTASLYTINTPSL